MEEFLKNLRCPLLQSGVKVKSIYISFNESVVIPKDAKDFAKSILNQCEGFDGGGYPKELRSENIPLCTRILNLAGSIEAMLSTRPYRDALTLKEIKRVVE